MKLHDAAAGKPVLLHPVAQSITADTEFTRGLGNIAARLGERLQKHFPFDPFERLTAVGGIC